MADITDTAARLSRLLQRAKEEVMIPEADVSAFVAELRAMKCADLLTLVNDVKLAAAGRTKGDIIRRITGKLNAGRRVMAQTEV